MGKDIGGGYATTNCQNAILAPGFKSARNYLQNEPHIAILLWRKNALK